MPMTNGCRLSAPTSWLAYAPEPDSGGKYENLEAPRSGPNNHFLLLHRVVLTASVKTTSIPRLVSSRKEPFLPLLVPATASGQGELASESHLDRCDGVVAPTPASTKVKTRATFAIAHLSASTRLSFQSEESTWHSSGHSDQRMSQFTRKPMLLFSTGGGSHVDSSNMSSRAARLGCRRL